MLIAMSSGRFSAFVSASASLRLRCQRICRASSWPAAPALLSWPGTRLAATRMNHAPPANRRHDIADDSKSGGRRRDSYLAYLLLRFAERADAEHGLVDLPFASPPPS